MNFPDYFADAESSFDDADFIIFGIPYDKTSSFRSGAAKAPKMIRQASWNFETFNMNNQTDILDMKIHDYGNLDVEFKKPTEMVKIVNDFAQKIVNQNKIPIALGGEHSITSGIVDAFDEDIAVLSLDAHMDFRDEYEDEKYNHACVIRRIFDNKNIRNIAVLGVRSAEKDEYLKAKKEKLFFKISEEIQKHGIDQIISETKKHLKDKKIYLTLDIDVLDPCYAPGTSTPEPFGISTLDVKQIIESFSSQLIGFDVVEVCPNFDHGQTSILAAKFVRVFLENVYKRF